jgi:putative radical SAM enzyme (TIGR03279 family)
MTEGVCGETALDSGLSTGTIGSMSDPTVLEIVEGSPAAAAGLAVGDELVAVNGAVPSDVIEYQQLIDDADPHLVVRREGVERPVTIPKSAGEPLGIRLNASIFDRVQTCDNHCEFCFIYQLPPGMRKSLYLKDDDYRLSFLYGNFTTLTRFTELDLARVVEERLGPLYVSIHATDPQVRTRMLRNPRGATSLRWLRALLEHDVTVHGQVVLCPGINNGGFFERTAAEIITRYPKLASVGIVPLGLSRYNTETHLVVHDQATARRDLDAVHYWQDRALEVLGRRMFFASDELYLRAEVPIPAQEAYEGYVQHENGIGMVRSFYEEIERLEDGTRDDEPVMTGEWRTIPAAPAEGYRAPRHTRDDPDAGTGPAVIVTGEYGAKALEPIVDRLARLAGRDLRILAVRNEFFGGNTGVSGLLVGSDIQRTLANDRAPAGRYLIPDVALSGDVFLDDVPLADIVSEARSPVIVAPATAGGLVAAATR